MSAAVMSNFYFPPGTPGYATDSQGRVHNWMLAQMAQYPPPPGPEQQHHYNALYPAPAGSQQLPEHDQLQYSSLNQPVYSKIESVSSEQRSPNHQINHLAHDLQNQAGLQDHQQQQHVPIAGLPMQQPLPHGEASTPSQTSMMQRTTSEQNQKSNRLRKACDSCSIRKVKV